MPAVVQLMAKAEVLPGPWRWIQLSFDPGAAIDWSEIRYDQQFPESDIEAVRSIGEERIEIAERTDDRRPDD